MPSRPATLKSSLVQTIDLAKAQRFLAGAGIGFEIIDARFPPEYKHGHIEGASNVPVVVLRKRLRELDRNRTWLVTPEGGRRSELAVYLLRQAGLNALPAERLRRRAHLWASRGQMLHGADFHGMCSGILALDRRARDLDLVTDMGFQVGGRFRNPDARWPAIQAQLRESERARFAALPEAAGHAVLRCLVLGLDTGDETQREREDACFTGDGSFDGNASRMSGKGPRRSEHRRVRSKLLPAVSAGPACVRARPRQHLR